MSDKSKDPINHLFDQMDKWRHLPSYQLERHIDLFFSLYLPQVLEEDGYADLFFIQLNFRSKKNA